MEIKEKLSLIEYPYKCDGKYWNESETNDFFDLELSKLLFEKSFNMANSQNRLLSYFDFQEIFNNFDDGISDRQSFLIKFMAIRNVEGVDLLLQNMPSNMQEQFFYQLYTELKKRDDSNPYWLSKIVCCIKDQDKIQFVNNIINELNDDEILQLIRELYEKKKDIILFNLLKNEKFINIAIERINAPFFYEMLEELNLDDDLKIKRENELKNIIINFHDYDIDDIKRAYCDLYFHDIPKNVALDIKTIISSANDDIIFKNEYIGKLYDVLCNIYTFLNSDSDYINDNARLLNNCTLNYEILSKCYLMCQKRFKELVSQSIKTNVTENIEPQILTSSSGNKVRLYNIENQTEKQKHFTMLISTIPCSDNPTLFKQIYCSDENGEIKKGRRSCSLINERKLSSLFGGRNRIIFGYDDLIERRITSATLGDGATDGNENRFRRNRRIRENSYLSIDSFIAKTQGHNELAINMGTSGKIMQPSYILTTNETPSQLEIDIASEFDIPIRYVNISKYEQDPDNAYSMDSYNYYAFSKNVAINNKKIQKSI